jgi:hypothetical protein
MPKLCPPHVWLEPNPRTTYAMRILHTILKFWLYKTTQKHREKQTKGEKIARALLCSAY